MRIQRQNESFAWRLAAPQQMMDQPSTPPAAVDHDQYIQKLESYHKALSELGINSQTLYGHETDKGWSFDDPIRQKKHELLKEFMWNTGGTENPHLHDRGVDSVPREGKAIFLAGQAGSGKGTILGHPQFKEHMDADQFYTSNPDPHKPIAAYLGMVPTQDELDQHLRAAGYGEDFFANMPKFSPMDLSPLVHEEISDLNKDLVAKALKKKINIIFDGTFASAKSALQSLGKVHKHQYGGATGVLVDAPMDFSLPRADSRYARGHQSWLDGGHEDGFDDTPRGSRLFGKLRELTAKYGLDDELNQRHGQHDFMPAQGGRYVPKFVSKGNEATDGESNSASSQNFRLFQPLMSSSVVTDARRTLKDKLGNYIAIPKIVSGRGDVFGKINQALQGVPPGIIDPNEPPYETDWSRPADPTQIDRTIDKIMSSPKNEEPRSFYESLPRYALRRLAAANQLDQEIEELQAKYTDSYEHIVDRFEAGEFDFDTLLQLLFARAQFRRELNEEGDQSLEAAYARSEGFDPDDWRHALNGAFYGDALTEEQKQLAQQAIEAGWHGTDSMM